MKTPIDLLRSTFHFQLFINGQFVDSKSGKTFDAINPATGEKICDVSEGDKVNRYHGNQSAFIVIGHSDRLTLMLPWKQHAKHSKLVPPGGRWMHLKEVASWIRLTFQRFFKRSKSVMRYPISWPIWCHVTINIWLLWKRTTVAKRWKTRGSMCTSPSDVSAIMQDGPIRSKDKLFRPVRICFSRISPAEQEVPD